MSISLLSVFWWIRLSLHYTLVGPTVTRPVKDPLAVLLHDNLLYIDGSCAVPVSMLV